MKRYLLLTMAFFLCLTSLGFAQQPPLDKDAKVEKSSENLSNSFFKNLSSGYTLEPEFKIGGKPYSSPERNFVHPIGFSSAGDLNGDGYADFYGTVTTADDTTPNLTDEVSKQVIYYGSETGITLANSRVIRDRFKFVADITGSGVAEAIKIQDGKLVIVSDQSNGEFTNVLEKEVLDVPSEVTYESYGDFNGDGYNDLIIYDQQLSLGLREIFMIYGGKTLDEVSIDTLSISNQLYSGFGRILYSDVDNNGTNEIIEVSSIYSESSPLVITVFQNDNGQLYEVDRDTIITNEGFSSFDMFYGKVGILDMNNDNNKELVLFIRKKLRILSIDETEGEYYGNSTLNSQVYEATDFAIIGDFNNTGSEEILIFWETLQLITSDSSLVLSAETIPTNEGEDFWLPANYNVSRNHGGDFNGDGINDILVSFNSVDSRGYRVYLGNSSGTFDQINELNFGLDNYKYLSNDVLSLGDINDDGIDDFGIVYSGLSKIVYLGESRIEIFFGEAFSDNMIPDLVISNPEDPFSYNYSPDTGDFNGDGIPDLLVPVRYSTYDTPDSRINIYYGGISFDSIEDHTIFAKDSYPEKPATIRNTRSIGDINGDGFDDIMYSTSASQKSSHIILGGSSISTIPDITLPFYASNFSKIGDFNNDGREDFAVVNDNHIYIYSGFDKDKGEVFNDEPITTLFSGSDGLTGFGESIAPGDFNGDGVVDLAVTLVFHSNFETDQGSEVVRIYQGGSYINSEVDGKIFLRAKDFASTTFTENVDTLRISRSVIMSVPDQNNDGADELMLSTGGFNTTNAAVYFGGDLDTMGTNIGILLKAPNPSLGLGPNAKGVFAVGDFNGDKKNDYLLPQVRDYNFLTDPVYIFTSDQFLVNTEEQQITQISDFSLDQNYPNPFNPTSIISFNLPIASSVSLKVYDVTGRLVATLINNQKETAGTHSITLNAKGWASGVYFYRLEADGFVETKKLTLIK